MQTSDDIEIRLWVKRGIMLVNTNALDWDDPDHVYNQIVALGKDPEDYGIRNPYEEQFEGWTRSQLMREVINLRRELTEAMKLL